MKHPLLAHVLLILVSSCAANSRNAQPRQAAANGAMLHNPNLTRELAPMPLHAVAADGNFFTARVESIEQPKVIESGGLYQVTIPIGTQQPMHCFIYPQAINLAQTLRLFVNSVVVHVDGHDVVRVEAGQVAGMPYLSLTTRYTSHDGSKVKQTGEVKYIAARAETSTTLCMHDEAGYVKTFERVALGFIGSEEFAAAEDDPARKLLVWRSLSVETSATDRVGVLEERLYEGETGFAFASSRSVISAAEDGTLQASDEAENQFSDENGQVLEAKYVKVSDDAVSYNLNLSREHDASYSVTGLFAGKKLEQRLQSSEALQDFASQSARLRKLFASRAPAQPLHWLTFLPTSPTRLMTVDFTRSDNGHGRSGVIKSGGEAASVEIDRMGIEQRVSTPFSTVKRIWQHFNESHS